MKEDKDMSAIKINKNNFNEEVLRSDKPVLLDFWASWCGPCRMVAPILDEIAEEREDIKVCKINIDEEPELASEYQIMSIPSLMVVRDGKIVNEMVNFRGETVYGEYDLVPILNSFIERNPDFAYRGARATLAVTGSEGIFGYRIQTADEAEIAACKALVQELRNQGYLLACNSFVNVAYNRVDATYIQNDIKMWKEEIVPVIGDVDIMVYAAGSDIENYNGSKFNVMQNEGFRYFISSTNNSANSQNLELNNAYLRQYRIMVTGSTMVNDPNQLMPYFNPHEVMITGR
jgi:thioredoxin 1